MSPSVPKPSPRVQKARKPVRRSKRKAANLLRVYGSKAFRDHLHAAPCLWCGIRGDPSVIHQAHFGKHGTGTKTHWTQTGPLCGGQLFFVSCHDRLDRRSSARTWFTPAERELIETRQRAFVADWQSRQPPERPTQETSYDKQ